MAQPKELTLSDVNDMVGAFHAETDRGAAVLAGGFVEHFLGSFLRSAVQDEQVADKLFGSVGPLNSFMQRITVAYAFRFIPRAIYDDLNLIREIRNHFAHHPLDTSFATPQVVDKAKQLSSYREHYRNVEPPKAYRHAYLVTCSTIAAQLWMAMQEGGAKPLRPLPPPVLPGNEAK